MSDKESFQQHVFNLIQSMTGEKNTLAVPRLFLDATGDLETGVFLSQLVYWSDKGSRKDGYIFKTIKEWGTEIYLTEYAIRRARKKLEDYGILQTMVKKANGNPTVHYKLLQKPLIDWLVRFQSIQTEKEKERNFKSEDSLTETTSEITTETTLKHNRCNLSDARVVFSNTVNVIMNQYFDYHQQVFNSPHPKLSDRSYNRVGKKINRLLTYGFDDGRTEENIDIDYNDLLLMARKHFERVLRKTCKTNGNILHFVSDANLLILIETFITKVSYEEISEHVDFGN